MPFQVTAVALEGFDNTVDVSDEDERVASVEEVDDGTDFGREDSRFDAADMEDYFYSDEAAKEADLEE